MSGRKIGDIMHHVMQVDEPDFSTSFCADRDVARTSRRRILAGYADTPTLIMPCHFPAPITAGWSAMARAIVSPLAFEERVR